MKKITKIIAFAAMILIALCLTACGGPNGGETPVQPEQENREYTVNVASGITNGTVTVRPTSAAEGTTVTITITPDEHAFLANLEVTDGSQTLTTNTINDNKKTFVMPAKPVNVTASFCLWPTPTTVTLGEEGSGYTVYRAIGDYDILGLQSNANSWPTFAVAGEHYFNEYESFVDDAVAGIEADLANKNQATQNYFKPWLDNIKAKAGTYARNIVQVLSTIYNGSEILFPYLINSIPTTNEFDNTKERNVLCYLLEIVFYEQYGKGFSNKNAAMNSKYTSKKTNAISKISNRLDGVSQDDLISDINYNNCVQVTQILDQKLFDALVYLNQSGLDLDLNITKKIINLVGSAQAVSCLCDYVKNINTYYTLDSKMENAVKQNTQLQLPIQSQTN